MIIPEYVDGVAIPLDMVRYDQNHPNWPHQPPDFQTDPGRVFCADGHYGLAGTHPMMFNPYFGLWDRRIIAYAAKP